MPLADFVSKPTQRVAYMFPETDFNVTGNATATEGTVYSGGFNPTTQLRNVFIFQFWPQQVQDNYTPNYATKSIPGGSHPIFQWTSGSGRDISFTAQFVSEIREDRPFNAANTDFRARITSQAAVSPTSGALGAVGSAPILGPLFLPSARYTVNVAAAIAALQQYLYPSYPSNEDIAKPPRKLILVLPGTKLGRGPEDDGILCIMRGASVTMESWFPNGELRAASVSLRFSEVVQRSSGAGNASAIKYIGAEAYTALAKHYTSNVNNPGELGLSNV